MRFHLLGLPHTQVTADYLTCAYTQKVRKFVTMMAPHHEVILYSGGETDVQPAEHVECGRPTKYFPTFDTVLDGISWDPNEDYWRDFLDQARAEIEQRVEPGDFILATTSPTTLAASSVRDRALCIEWAVGYENVWSKYAIFESYAWMHHVYGMRQEWARCFDDVVPNFFDVSEFKVELEHGGYLLYMGRMIGSKGPQVADLIAERLDMPIVYAGPGASTPAYAHQIVCDDGNTLTGEYRGTVDQEERRDLLAGAACVLMPTQYIEPFGGVAIEALLSGVPVAASDWGAFTETITPNFGRRFRTLAEGCTAVEECLTQVKRGYGLRYAAMERWGLEAVRPRFERSFDRFSTLWGKGWDA